MGISNKLSRVLWAAILITIIIMTISWQEVYAGEKGVYGRLQTNRGDEVITEYREERVEEVPYETLYQYDNSLSSGETQIKIKGQNGTIRVIGIVTTVDGTIKSREEISSTTIKEPIDEVILVGSLSSIPHIDYEIPELEKFVDVSYDASVYVSLKDKYQDADAGKKVVDEAMKYLGNPYVWGGSSLTGGCDCSGFVYALFNSLGYGVPRNDMEYVYPIVAGEMLPGDVITYPDHYTIYIGGGMEIGALNSRKGICITPVGYVGESYIAVRIAD